MTACALCGGAKIDYRGNAPTTRSMVTRFRASGAYDIIPFVSPKHSGLKRGDILVRQGAHTVMVLDDFAALKDNVEIAVEVINGKWGSGTDRKKRLTDAGYDYGQIQALVNQMLKG